MSVKVPQKCNEKFPFSCLALQFNLFFFLIYVCFPYVAKGLGHSEMSRIMVRITLQAMKERMQVMFSSVAVMVFHHSNGQM